MIKMALLGMLICFVLGGCTVKWDNPFYPPSTIDVNKSESKGANNYLHEDAQENKGH